MCSNETLKATMADLKKVVKENTDAQNGTKSSVDRLEATFDTWRETRCGQNMIDLNMNRASVEKAHRRINSLETNAARAAGKWAGIYASLILLIQVGGLFVAYQRLIAHIAEGG